MKKLRKILVLGLVALSLAACGSKTETTEAGGQTEKPSGDTISFALNANFPPYEYYEGNEMVGIDIDLAKAIGDKIGYNVEFQDMKFDNIIASVNSGKADAGISGITKTEDRAKSVDFSLPYQTSKQLIVVKEGSDIMGPEDLPGKKIATQVATTGDTLAIEEFGVENVQSFDNGADAILALNNSKADAVIIDEEPAKNFAGANEGLVVLDTEYAIEEYCIIFSKDNQELKDKVDGALEELIDDGTVDKIITSYIGE